MKSLMKRIMTMFCMAVLLFSSSMTVSASGKETPVGTNRGYIRAKLTYEYDEGVTGLSDDIIDFADGWTKKDGWYYYDKPVAPGDRVRFITCVHCPTEWTNDVENKKFKVIVTAQASEVAPNDTGWDKNTDILFDRTFDVWSAGYAHDEDVWIEEGKLTININEYQLDKNGNEVPYVNDKLIVPGQPVSKIVEFVLGGDLGANVKIIPEKPIKSVTVDGVDVDGRDIEPGKVLEYGITVKNPAPDERTITVTDVVDNRLIVIDTFNGTMIAAPGAGDRGGTIEWRVKLKGGESEIVRFRAVVADGVVDDVIPNTAEATIVGKKLKSNTVLVGIGEPPVIKKIIARATYDTANFFLPIIIILIAMMIIVIVIKKIRKIRKGDLEYEKCLEEKKGENES